MQGGSISPEDSSEDRPSVSIRQRLALFIAAVFILLLFVMAAGIVASLTGPRVVAPIDNPQTTADKLVGTWRRVEELPPHVPKRIITIDFTKDGTCTSRVKTPGKEPTIESSQYVVVGDQIHTTPTDPNLPNPWVMRIDLLTFDKLIVRGHPGYVDEAATYLRVRPR